ncbi:hypothetical protein Rcae01_03480 [Novipirellula caenicola]|uniref:Uncharacterized protein n=1 Tax=Novipirellula caenicola TaxID=1536901 RepID=A0ABP9VSA8_9BACT
MQSHHVLCPPEPVHILKRQLKSATHQPSAELNVGASPLTSSAFRVSIGSGAMIGNWSCREGKEKPVRDNWATAEYGSPFR